MATLPVILARPSLMDKEEQAALRCGLPVYTNRSQIPPNSTVIGRYSVLPYYQEVADDLAVSGSRLVNTPAQHAWIADIEQWYQDLVDVTPQTWFGPWADIPDTGGAYVLKGRTNSRKWRWSTHMFAPTKAAIPTIYQRLMEDTFISDQGVVIREYVPLKVREVGLNGLTFAEEWRMFYWGDQLMASGYYWACAEEIPRELPPGARKLGDRVASRIASGGLATFYVLDIAQTAAGDWIVIEVNDGQMSGLSAVDPHSFYTELAAAASL